MRKQLISILIASTVCYQVAADIRLHSIDEDGKTGTVTSDGKQARMDSAGEAEYVLFNFQEQSFNMIDPRNRQIMQMDVPTAAAGADAASKMATPQLKKLGAGPRIAGYKTTKYSMSAGGKPCETIYASREVTRLPGMQELLKAMSKMQQQTRDSVSGFSAMMDACDQAELNADDLYQSIGVPLRSVDAQGRLQDEVTSIETNISVAAGYYQPPKGYQVVSMQQQMEQAQQQMQQLQNMPEMQQMMQQMQQMQNQPGAMPPPTPPAPGAAGEGGMQELLEQIKQMQQMPNQPAQ